MLSAEVEAAAKAAAERATRDGQENAAEIEKLGNEVDALKENLADARNAADMHAAKGERLTGELSALRNVKEGLEEELLSGHVARRSRLCCCSSNKLSCMQSLHFLNFFSDFREACRPRVTRKNFQKEFQVELFQ